MLKNHAAQLTYKQTCPTPPANIECEKMRGVICGLGQVCFKNYSEQREVSNKADAIALREPQRALHQAPAPTDCENFQSICFMSFPERAAKTIETICNVLAPNPVVNARINNYS
jgi:hypothetical protein